MQNRLTQSKGFHKKTQQEKQAWLKTHCHLTDHDIEYLANGQQHSSYPIINSLIENVIGTFHLPIGIIPYIEVNQQEYSVPVVVEETSIIAACNKTTKQIKKSGGSITASHQGSSITGQIVFSQLNAAQFEQLVSLLNAHMPTWIQQLKTNLLKSMEKRGGGFKNWSIQSFNQDSNDLMASLYIELNTQDAMGANLVTQTCEWVARQIKLHLNQPILFSIVCNYSNAALVKVTCQYPIEPDLGQPIADASRFAKLDIHRASTHNKGIMNAIDGLMIATGNDWRAVSTAMHSYACRSGQYQPLGQWQYHNGQLEGQLIAPIQIGTIGGVTRVHPDAQMCLKLLNYPSAQQLAMIAGSIGLVQNLAALKALTDEGLTQGHMRLHIDNLLMASQINDDTKAQLKPLLIQHLKTHQTIQHSDVQTYLKQLK